MTPYGDNSHEPLILTLCLEEESILVSRAILDVLGRPRQVQMLMNDERKMLLLQSCSVEDCEAVVVQQQPFSMFEISGHSLLKRIRKLTGWTDNQPRAMRGNYIPTHHVIVFNLLLAEPSPPKKPTDGSSSILH